MLHNHRINVRRLEPGRASPLGVYAEDSGGYETCKPSARAHGVSTCFLPERYVKNVFNVYPSHHKHIGNQRSMASPRQCLGTQHCDTLRNWSIYCFGASRVRRNAEPKIEEINDKIGFIMPLQKRDRPSIPFPAKSPTALPQIPSFQLARSPDRLDCSLLQVYPAKFVDESVERFMFADSDLLPLHGFKLFVEPRLLLF